MSKRRRRSPQQRRESYAVPAIDPAVEALSDDALKAFHEKVRMIIDRRIAGIDYAERRRQQMVTQLGAVVGLGLALLPLLSDAATPFKLAYTAASLTLVLGGVITWRIYATQTNPPYSFLGPAQTRTWFYRQALPDMEALQAAAERPIDEFQRVHDAQFEQFARVQATVMSDPRLDASDDLRQLFLLHQNEMTKNRQLTLLSRALTRTLGVALVVAVVAGIVGLFVAIDRHDAVSSRSTAEVDGATVTAEWRTTGAERTTNGGTESELVVDVTIVGGTTSPSSFSRLTASDAKRRGIPIDADFDAINVPGGESVTVGPLIAWVPQALVDKIKVVAAH